LKKCYDQNQMKDDWPQDALTKKSKVKSKILQLWFSGKIFDWD